jgi:predicted HNH restriction endonuclease
MAETKTIPSKNLILRLLNLGQQSDLVQSIPMTKKFANKLNKLQRKLQIEERDVKNPNEMKKLAMGDKRWDKHIDALQDLWRAEFNKKQKQKKEDSDIRYVANKKGGKVKYSKGGGVRTAKYKI